MKYGFANVTIQNFSFFSIYGFFAFDAFFLITFIFTSIWTSYLTLASKIIAFVAFDILIKCLLKFITLIFNFNLYFLFWPFLFTLTINCFDLLYHIVIGIVWYGGPNNSNLDFCKIYTTEISICWYNRRMFYLIFFIAIKKFFNCIA